MKITRIRIQEIIHEEIMLQEGISTHDKKAAKEVLNIVQRAAVKAELNIMEKIGYRKNIPYDHNMIELLMLRELQEWVGSRIMDVQKR